MQNRMPNVNTGTQSVAIKERNHYFYNRRRLNRSKEFSVAENVLLKESVSKIGQ